MEEAVMEAVMVVAVMGVIKSHVVLEMPEPGEENIVEQPGELLPRQKPRVHPLAVHQVLSKKEAYRAFVEADKRLHAAQIQYNAARKQLENAISLNGGRALSKASTKSHSRSTSSKRPHSIGGRKTRRSKH